MCPTPNDFVNFQFSQKSNDGTYANHGDSYGGEFTQVRPDSDIPAGAPVGLENGSTYPNPFGYGYDSGNRMFSSNVNGDPDALLQSTKAGIDAHADMQYAFGLCSPVAGLGRHDWLRDSLTNPGQKQPGNEIPHYTAQIARRIAEKQGDD